MEEEAAFLGSMPGVAAINGVMSVRWGAAVRGTALAATACVLAACTSGTGTSAAPGTLQSPVQSQVQSPSQTPGTAGAPGTAGTTPDGTATPPSAHPAAAWPEFNENAGRTGVAVGLPQAGQLTRRWSAQLDGAVYGQPLVVGGMVIAATENDSVYALSQSTGAVIWRSHLGTPVPQSQLNGCGDIFPLGITGTPVYDQGNGLVYAVGETVGYQHVLFGLAVTNGAVRVRRDIDEPSRLQDPAYDQQRPALTITDGRVYAAFGGLAGDCGQYQGMVVGVPLSGAGPLVSWHTPTTREGAVWGTAGPVVGPDGDLWVSTGNGAAESGDPYDGSDSVDRLSPDLRRVGFFAPATWATDNRSDLDLGSTQPVLAAGNTTLIVGKRGVGYLLDTLNLGGIGHQQAALPVCAAFGAAAVNGSTVYEPCRDGGGLAAVYVNAQRGQIRVLWRGPSAGNGSPVLGDGAVWVTGYGNSDGTLYELDPDNGVIRSQIEVGAGLPHFSSLSLAGGTAFVGTLAGVVAVDGV
jgi:outer membrane protein assembly factor BamB